MTQSISSLRTAIRVSRLRELNRRKSSASAHEIFQARQEIEDCINSFAAGVLVDDHVERVALIDNSSKYFNVDRIYLLITAGVGADTLRELDKAKEEEKHIIRFNVQFPSLVYYDALDNAVSSLEIFKIGNTNYRIFFTKCMSFRTKVKYGLSGYMFHKLWEKELLRHTFDDEGRLV